MDLFPKDWQAYLDILLVFFRLMGFMLLVPILSHKAIPPTVKILLSLSLSLAIYPIVKHQLPPLPNQIEGLVLAVLREGFFGAIMGFVAYLTFEGIALGAHFTGYQMGLGTAGLLDPHADVSSSVLTALYGWAAILIFLMADLHHVLIANFTASFGVTRELTMAHVSTPQPLITLTGRLFLLAIQMAAPFTLILLGCQVVFSILARLMPQLNVLVFSFPVTLLAGLLGLYFLSPELIDGMEGILQDASSDMLLLLRSL